ncbi:MAG: hypothetical protein ABFS38_13800 [Bacteroidota bacterium]
MKRAEKKTRLILCVTALAVIMNLHAGELLIGTAETDITPELPVALRGQFHLRLADTVESPLTANVIALESRTSDLLQDMAIMVSCDLVAIPTVYVKGVRAEVQNQLPDIDVNKIFINATHTHTAPVLVNDPKLQYPIPKEGVLQPDTYQKFFVQQVSDAILRAWEKRTPGSVTWGLGHASVAQNRRLVFSTRATDPGFALNGKAQMYGTPKTPDFRNIEGMAEDDVNTLFFWDRQERIIAMAIAVPCPAQEVESRRAINADYWHPVRDMLKHKYGEGLCVVGWIGAAGDQSPHLMYRRAAEERMRELRNLTRLEEIARRIVLAVEETYETVKNERQTDVQLIHKVEILELPEYKISERESRFAKAESEKYAAMIEADPGEAKNVARRRAWNADVVRRYEVQQKGPLPLIETEVHILRIGDIVVCTNPYELFTDYGIRMQARSKALQTFIIQLTGAGYYLPTSEAVEGGGYSAIPASCPVGPEGGQILVEKTVKLIDELFVGEE